MCNKEYNQNNPDAAANEQQYCGLEFKEKNSQHRQQYEFKWNVLSFQHHSDSILRQELRTTMPYISIFPFIAYIIALHVPSAPQKKPRGPDYNDVATLGN